MNTPGIIICLLASMAGGYAAAYALNEAFSIGEKLSQIPLTVKIRPWMIAAASLLLIIIIGVIMYFVSAPEITYYIISGIIIGIMLRLLPSAK